MGADFVGDITVSGDTSYYIELVSVDGETYRGSNEYDISVLEDQPPTISFDGRDATRRLPTWKKYLPRRAPKTITASSRWICTSQ